MTAPQTSSRLELLQARFQQRQLMEKEQKLLQLYDQQQQRAHQVAQRGSAGSNTSNGSSSATTTQSVTRTTTTTSHSTSNAPGGKVRQMFDERRQTTVKGIDRSYPLEPLENKARKTIGPTSQRNGTTVTNRHSVTVKRTIRADTNGNVNSISSKPAINYHEDVTRETFGPKLVHREEDIEEFYNENDLYNQNISEANNHGTDRGRSIDRAKPAKGEVLIVAGTGPRIEKTPSPDDPSRRIISNETKNVRRNNSNITLTPTSRNSIKKKGPENSQSVDVVDSCKEDRARITTDNPTKDNLAFVIDLAEDTHSKASSHTKKASNDRQLSEKISSCESRQKGSSVRPASALSTNSSCTTQGGNSAVSKNRMAAKTRGVTSGNRTPSATKANNPSLSNADSGLPGCKICGRRFTPDRLSLHEQICVKATQKKRKTFDPVIQRTKGTELEPFVKKISKKGSDKKSKKPEGKSNWRRKHEDFINAIRSAKQMQAHLAAGGKLSDLPPPPASDTSDYIQCPHCGRKFNQAAAERHIPKCQHMLHNKPNPRAPPKAKR